MNTIIYLSRYEVAVNDGRLVSLYRHQIKIRDYKEDMFQELKLRLVTISRILGITHVPTVEQIDEIIQFLTNEYQDFGIEEIAYAFQLYCAEKLDVDKNVQTFNRFQLRFIGQVLNGYRRLRSQALAKQDKDEKEKKYIDEINQEKQKTFEQKEKEKNNEAHALYNNLMAFVKREKIIPSAFPWVAVYDYMSREKLVDMNTQDKLAFKSSVIDQLKMEWPAEAADRKARGVNMQAIKPWHEDEVEILRACKERYVKFYFNKLINTL